MNEMSTLKLASINALQRINQSIEPSILDSMSIASISEVILTSSITHVT